MTVVVTTRGVERAHRLLGGLARDLAEPGDELEALLPEVLELQQEWWATRGRGSWGGHDLYETGALKRATTQAGEHRVFGDELVFGFEDSAQGPGLYGPILADHGLSAILDPTEIDAEQLADAFLDALFDAHELR